MKAKKTISSILATAIIVGALSAPTASFASAASQNTVPVTSTINVPVTQLPINNNFSPVHVNPASVKDPGAQINNVVSNVIKKAITSAFRYGGDTLAGWLKHLSPNAAKLVKNGSTKIADFLDSITNWQEVTVAAGLMNIGFPPAEAYETAKWIVWLAGI